jgi:hypothetical protein
MVSPIVLCGEVRPTKYSEQRDLRWASDGIFRGELLDRKNIPGCGFLNSIIHAAISQKLVLRMSQIKQSLMLISVFFGGAVMKKLATCIVAIVGFIGTSAFAEDMAVEAPIGASLGKVKTDFNAAVVSVTTSAGNFTIPGFSFPNRVYPSEFMGDGQIGYTSYVTGGLGDGKVDLELRAGLNYQFQ